MKITLSVPAGAKSIGKFPTVTGLADGTSLVPQAEQHNHASAEIERETLRGLEGTSSWCSLSEGKVTAARLWPHWRANA
jgi:hypothetical protein